MIAYMDASTLLGIGSKDIEDFCITGSHTDRSDPKHIHLGMATDGFNPWSEKRSTDSMWPVMFLNYNLPPWLVTKKYFVMLCLLIPTKVGVNSQNFDVFLQPAIDELQTLWARPGVRTKDARAFGGVREFNLRACLMWTLHDFPGYGMVAGLVTKGFKACPICGPNTISRYSQVLRKNVFCDCHRRYLQENYYFRGDFAAFDYGAEHGVEHNRLSGNQTIRYGRESERFITNGGTDRGGDFPAKVHGVKRVSALFQLPYWRVSVLDPCTLEFKFTNFYEFIIVNLFCKFIQSNLLKNYIYLRFFAI